ncbi:hypothetical protein C8J57DRAFT_1619584 [Mycena rebaudengoi]|nr:hypothetical protein C8J57DRAFT_1619584 [Mycena rebaudengoi]
MATGKMMGGGEIRLKKVKYSKKHGVFEIWRGRLKEVCPLLTILRGKSKLKSDLIKIDVNTKVVEPFKGFPMVLVSPLGCESNNPNPKDKSKLKSDLIRNDVNTKIVELVKGFPVAGLFYVSWDPGRTPGHCLQPVTVVVDIIKSVVMCVVKLVVEVHPDIFCLKHQPKYFLYEFSYRENHVEQLQSLKEPQHLIFEVLNLNNAGFVCFPNAEAPQSRRFEGNIVELKVDLKLQHKMLMLHQ